MSVEETKKELELRSKITDLVLLETKSIRERSGAIAQANSEYQANLAILQAQNKEIEKYDRSIQVTRQNTTAMHNSNVQGAGASSSAMGVLVTATKALNQEMFNAAGRLEDLSAERRELTNLIAKEIGGSSRLFNELANDAKTAADMIAAVNTGTVDKMKRYYETLGGVAGTSFDM